MLFDTAKGFVPAFVATEVAGPLAGVLAGGAAMVGHARPLFLGFAKGGKTVATAGGTILGVAPVVGLDRRRRMDLRLRHHALRVDCVDRRRRLTPDPRVRLGEPWPVIAFGGAAAAAVLVLHRENVRRLFAGTESRAVPWRRRLRAATARAEPSSGPSR